MHPTTDRTTTKLETFLSDHESSSKENLKSLISEIHEFLISLFAEQADHDLMSKITSSLGFGLCLLDGSQDEKRDLMLVLESVLFVARIPEFQHLIVQNALIVSYLLSSHTLRNLKDPVLHTFLEIWSLLTAYHGQLAKLATPAFVAQFQEMALQLVEQDQVQHKDITEHQQQEIPSLAMQVFFSLLSSNSASTVSGLASLSNNTHFHSRLLNLISNHPNLHINSCALGILACVLHDQPDLKAHVFGKDNLTEIGSLLVKLLINQTHTRYFRDLMMGVVYGLEAEGLCGLEIVEHVMAAQGLLVLQAEMQKSKSSHLVGSSGMVELVVALSKTKLPKSHALFSLSLFQGFGEGEDDTDERNYSSLFPPSNKSGSLSKLDIVEYFKAHGMHLTLQGPEPVVEADKKDIFAKAWLGILRNELQTILNLFKKASQGENPSSSSFAETSEFLVAFLHASLDFVKEGLLLPLPDSKQQQVGKVRDIIHQLMVHPLSQSLFPATHICALVLVKEALSGGGGVGLGDDDSVDEILSRRFPLLVEECIQSACVYSIQGIGRLLSIPKYAQWLAEAKEKSSLQKDASSFTFSSTGAPFSTCTLTLPILDLATDFKSVLVKRELEHREQVELLTAKLSALSATQSFAASVPNAAKQQQKQQPLQISVPVSYSEKMIATIKEVKSQSKKLQVECAQLRQEKEVLEASVAQMEADYADAVETGQKMAAKVQAVEQKLFSCQNQVHIILLYLLPLLSPLYN